MPFTTIGSNNWEEEIATMKAMLEKLAKKSDEKEVRIKQQEEKIARLTKKLEKHPTRSLAKTSESEEEGKAFVQSEAFEEKVY